MEYLGFFNTYLSEGFFFFRLKMGRNRGKYIIEISKKLYGVRKYRYQELDCIDLFLEIIHLLRCEQIDKCRVCRKFLAWTIEILIKEWDTVRFIELEDAFKLLTQIKDRTEFDFVPKKIKL